MAIAHEYLVRTAPAARSASAFAKAQATLEDQLRGSGATLRLIHRGLSPASALNNKVRLTTEISPLYHVQEYIGDPSQLSALPGVVSVEQNCWIRPMAVANDPEFPKMWAHQVIESRGAWDVSTGSPEIIVAVSDTGVDYRHPDLRAQMWINAVEQGGKPGADDDNNGCVDDIYGCDFADKDGDPRPPWTSGGEHGTHVAGIIGAIGNNGVGVVGVNWRVRLMALKGFPDAGQFANKADLIDTVYYAADNGARVLNCSWGSDERPGAAERDAFKYALSKGLVVVVAAGNSAADSEDFSPAGIPDVITVGASNSRDELSSFSNYGSVVDLLAPGGDSAELGGLEEDILSTVTGDGYEGNRGTSMAAPFVSGLAALVWSINPKLSRLQVEDLLKANADPVDVQVRHANQLRFRYGRINARKAAEATRLTIPKVPPLDCLPGEACADNSSLANGSRAKWLSEAFTPTMGGCQNDMRARSTETASFGFWALLGLPVLLLLLVRGGRRH